jgi:hypothetical protein
MRLEQLAAAGGRLGVLAGLVERAYRIPELGSGRREPLRQCEPVLASVVVPRLDRWRKRRVGKRADGYHDQVGLGRLGVQDL